jgi:hypothetical protein
MSTALNDRDAILQAAAVRIINPKNASILLTASPSLFHVNTAGAVDAAATTITATLIGLEGDVTFTADGATLTGVTGKSAAVRFADMQGPAAIVTARIVAGGEPFTHIDVAHDSAFAGHIGEHRAHRSWRRAVHAELHHWRRARWRTRQWHARRTRPGPALRLRRRLV